MAEPNIPKKEKKTATMVAVIVWIAIGIPLFIRGIVGLKQGVTYVTPGGYRTGPGTPGQLILVGLFFVVSGCYSLWLLLRRRPIKTARDNARDVT